MTVEDFIRTIAHTVEEKTKLTEGEEFERACLLLARTRCDYTLNKALSIIVEGLDSGPAERNTWTQFKLKLRTTFGDAVTDSHGAYIDMMKLRLESFDEKSVAVFLNNLETHAFRWASIGDDTENWSVQFSSQGEYTKHLKFISICALASAAVQKEKRDTLIAKLKKVQLHELPRVFARHMSDHEKPVTVHAVASQSNQQQASQQYQNEMGGLHGGDKGQTRPGITDQMDQLSVRGYNQNQYSQNQYQGQSRNRGYYGQQLGQARNGGYYGQHGNGEGIEYQHKAGQIFRHFQGQRDQQISGGSLGPRNRPGIPGGTSRSMPWEPTSIQLIDVNNVTVCSGTSLTSMLEGLKNRPHNGPPLLPGLINGQRVHYFLDSGSAVSIIHKSTIDRLRLNLEIRPSSLKLQGVSGALMGVMGEADIVFNWGSMSMVQTFVVIGGHKAIPGSLLLGWDWLQKSNIIIHPGRNLVVFEGKEFKLLAPGMLCRDDAERLTAKLLPPADSRNSFVISTQSMSRVVFCKSTKEIENVPLLFHGDIYMRGRQTFVSKEELRKLERDSKKERIKKPESKNNDHEKHKQVITSQGRIRSSFCHGVDKVTIPAFSGARVQVQIKVRMDGVLRLKGSFIVHPLLMHIEGLSVAPGLYEFENGKTTLILMNTTPSEIVVPRQKKICDIEYLLHDIEEANWPEGMFCGLTTSGNETGLVKSTVETTLEQNPSPFPDADKWLERLFSENLTVLPSQDRPLGKTSRVEHRIELTADAKPFKIPAYRVPHSRKALISKEIKAMLESGIIEPSTSPYSSPLLLVPKANGEYRPVIDFRRLNSQTVNENFPIPSIKSLLYDINKSTKILSSIDLEKGYFQIPLAEDCKHLTGFTTNDGHYQFVRCPMGLKNAPVTFSRLMSLLLHDAMGDGIFVYLDDILIASETVDEHKRKLSQVLGRLAEAGLTIKPSKCRFFQEKLVFLGHELSELGMRPNQLKIRAVKDFPTPNNSKELKSFLGLSNFFRAYVKDYGSIASPLNSLLKKSIKWEWKEEHEIAFNKLKSLLTSAPVLAFPDYNLPFEVHTDASMVGIGATLLQRVAGVPRPIAFASRKLSQAEVNYSATDREMLAIAWALKHWREVIQGYQVVVYSDHAPLVNTLKPTHRDPHGRRARYQVTLGEFNAEIRYIKGKVNYAPDALSRIQTGMDGLHIDESALNPLSLPPAMARQEASTTAYPHTCALFPSEGDPEDPLSREEIAGELRKCQTYGQIVKALEEGRETPKVAHIPTHEFILEDGILIRVSKPKNIRGRIMKSTRTVVIPESSVSKVLKWAHEGNGHLGFFKTLSFLRARFFFPRMTKVVGTYVRSCKVCPLSKGKVVEHPCGTYDVPRMPWERVFFDILSLPMSNQGNQYLLVFIDNFSRFTELVVIKDKRAETVARAFHNTIICRHGTPSVLVSDNGPEVFNEIMTKLCKLYNISRPRILPRRPQANGYCERLNRSILGILRTLTDDQKDNWCDSIPTLQSALNGSYHRPLGDSPDFLLSGRDKRLPYEILHNQSHPRYTGDTPETLFRGNIRAWKIFREAAMNSQDTARRYQESKLQRKPFEVGSQVFHQIEKKGLIRGKLQDSFEGPFRVLRFKKNGVLCRCIASQEEKTFHPDKLKPADKYYGINRE